MLLDSSVELTRVVSLSATEDSLTVWFVVFCNGTVSFAGCWLELAEG